MRLVATLLLTLTVGVLIAWGVALVIGWVIPVARVPVFLALSIWWTWTGWKYTKARDQALERLNSN